MGENTPLHFLTDVFQQDLTIFSHKDIYLIVKLRSQVSSKTDVMNTSSGVEEGGAGGAAPSCDLRGHSPITL